MANVPGAFIAIESPVESYAAEHCHHLRSRLEAAGYEVVLFQFPQAEEPSSYFANKYAHGGYGLTSDVVPYAGSLFYALDHFEAADSIRQAINSGKIVIAHKYLASNMVEQGATLQHPQERKGYFLWLDNLEARVLNTPRPDKTFVLQLSVTQIKSFKVTNQAVPAGKQSALYSELCDLYPKDFIRLDTERNGKSLDKAVLQDLLWHQVEPLLPEFEPVTSNDLASGEPLFNRTVVNQLPITHITMTTTQFLASQFSQIISDTRQGYRLPDYRAVRSRPLYLVPDYFEGPLLTSYTEKMDRLFKNYRVFERKLKKYLKSKSDHTKINPATSQSLLPLASMCEITLAVSDAELQSFLSSLLSHELPEAWALGQKLLKHCQRVIPSLTINAANVAYQASCQRAMRKVAQSLPQAHALDQTELTHLVQVQPRNEFDLLPHMLFEQTDIDFSVLTKKIQSWGFSQKEAAVISYLNRRSSINQHVGKALDAATYTWDILTSFSSLREVQTIAPLHIQRQTPRFGYHVPQIVEDAGLGEIYQDSFDLSMQLYSDLQQAGYELEAQLVTLFGHKQRALLTTTGRQLLTVIETVADESLRQSFLNQFKSQHPTIAAGVIAPPSITS
ncbi:MAG: hypothetical protein NVS1B7_6950 [Candidatus Saccharimonadales bacterium]